MRYFGKSRLGGDRKSDGFTLIELIVVVVILAVLIGVTIGGIYGYVNKARKVMDLQTARAIVDAQVYVKVQKYDYSDTDAFTRSGHTFKGNPNSDDYFLKVMSYIDSVSAPKTNKDWYWTVDYTQGKICAIYLSPKESGTTYELYPNVCKEFKVE